MQQHAPGIDGTSHRTTASDGAGQSAETHQPPTDTTRIPPAAQQVATKAPTNDNRPVPIQSNRALDSQSVAVEHKGKSPSPRPFDIADPEIVGPPEETLPPGGADANMPVTQKGIRGDKSALERTERSEAPPNPPCTGDVALVTEGMSH